MKKGIKKIFFVGITCLLTSVGYGQITKSDKGAKRNPILLFFHGATDKSFCNTDSLGVGDCIGGDLYLTAKGNVIYTFYCCCDNPDVFSIGTYKVKGDSIVCSFQKDYVVEKSRGSMSVNKWSLVLKKINCPAYKYYFTESYEANSEDGKKEIKMQIYVASKADKAAGSDFLKTISKIKQLKDL